MIQMIGWAIVHSVWQAGVIAVLTAGALFTLRRAAAATRYWVAVFGLAMMAATPVATVYVWQISGVAPSSPAKHQDVLAGQTAAPPSISNGAPLDKPAVTTRAERGSATAALGSSGSLERYFGWIVAVWLLGVLVFSMRTVAGFMWARRLTREGTKAVNDQLRGTAARIADHMGIRTAVRVLESSRVSVPMLVGWVRPVMLMPASVLTGLLPQQIEAILAHELAHVRRHDYVINLLQTVVETLYFYHPAAWWLSGRIREEREHACDDLAVAACGGDRVFYSRVLLMVEESRGAAPALAVAVSGGSLPRRIQRLLGVEQAHLDIGPRWYAGVFTIALAVVTAGGLIDDGQPRENESSWAASVDTRHARPDTVIRYPGSGPLADRWRWAEQQAKRNHFERYWIGYLIKGDEAGQTWLHFDRVVPVSMPGISMQGNVRLGGNFNTVHLAGAPLRQLLGDYEPNDVAVFLAYDGRRLARMHLASFAFPMNFNGAPVLWLDRVQDAESIERLQQLDATTRDENLREDLTAAIGAHRDARAAVPVLRLWAEDQNRPADVRKQAVEALANYQQPELLGVLAHVARTDPAEDVRAEAVEAIGELKDRAALDTLVAFARTLTERPQREAVEAIADMPGDRGLIALRALIDDRSLSVDIRRNAVESLAESSNAPEMLQTLTQLATRPDAEDIQRIAIEAMSEVQVDSSERLKALLNIVEHHSDPDMQARAAEAISELPESDAVLSTLVRIVREHSSEDVRRRALEGLSSLNHDERAGRILLDIAHTHRDDETQRRAVEFLSEFSHYPLFKEVAAIALSNQAVDVRRMAVETYIGETEVNDALAFARRVMATDAPFDVKRKVLEALGSMDGGAGIPVIAEIARSAKEPDLRKRAREALVESDDPRALDALRTVK